MSAALEKNRHALEMMGMGTASGGDPDAMRTARIGVWGGDGDVGFSSAGPLLGEALGDLLGRFWHRIDVGGTGPASDAVADAARMSADACGAAAAGPAVRRIWDTPYDFAVGIGEPPPLDSAESLVTVGAGGWWARAGTRVALGADANPAGPLAAAALAAAEAFKSVFAIGAERGAAPLPSPYEWDAWHGPPGAAGAPPSSAADLDIGEVHAFGIGAVSHALLWALERWPGTVTGTLHLVDPDTYDAGNPQRYMGTARTDIGRPKAAAAASRLVRAHPGLDAIAYETDMNGYYAEHNPDCRVRTALCGLDSREGRRQLGLKLPLTVVNMWTSEFHAGASTFTLEGGAWPCIICAYPEPAVGGVVDEASAIHAELGLPPPRVRELLDSGQSITESDARTVSAATGVRVGDIQLKPVRSVRTEMCATGTIASPRGPNREDVHVPLAFASAMAGVSGLAELARAVLGARDEPGQFQASVLRYPTADSWTRRRRDPGCRFCSDPVRRMAQAKYACDRTTEAAAQ